VETRQTTARWIDSSNPQQIGEKKESIGEKNNLEKVSDFLAYI